MMKLCCLTMIALALVLVLGSAGFGQESLLNAEDSRQEIQVGVYHSSDKGNQDWVREYDGRRLNFLSLESFDTYGYRGGLQYWLGVRDLFVGDQEIDYGFARRNSLTLGGRLNELTHRLARTPASNPWVAAQLSALVPAPPPPVEGVSWDTFKDLSPGVQFRSDRRVDELSLYANRGSSQRIGVTATWWNQAKDGQRQWLFRARQAKAGVINNRDRGGVALPIDNETTEGTFGTDLQIGKDSAINYRFVDTKFDDNRPGIAPGSELDFLPLNAITRIKSKTRSHVIKARSKISDRLQFTGVHISKQRTNSANDIPSGYADAGSVLDKKVNIDTSNVGLVFRATDSLSITGRWRRVETENLVPPIFRLVGTPPVPQTTPGNPALSGDLKSLEFEGVFTGIRRAYLRFGVERRQVDRERSPLHPDSEEFGLPFTSLSTDWKIQRAAFRYHPIPRLNLSANYDHWSSDNGGYTGTPNKRAKTNVNATYLIRDDFAVYGDLSRWNESNNEVRVAGAIPTPATNEDEAELREEAAGQGSRDRLVTTTIGTWFTVNDRLTLDADFSYVHLNAGTTWIIGYEPAYPPHLPPDFVPFRSRDSRWSVGANYVVNPKLRLRGGFVHSSSDGSSRVDPAKFAGLGPQWTPFNVRQDRWTLGFGYGLSQKDSLNLDFSVAKWADQIDAGNNGRYGLVRLAWVRQL